MRAAIPQASERRVCQLLDVPRSSMRRAPAERRLRRPLDAVLVERIRELIAKHPTFGYRKLWALLRYGEGLLVNLKAVYRILRQALVRAPAQRHATSARPGAQERHSGIQRALGHGPHPHLLRRGWLGPPGGDHRLP